MRQDPERRRTTCGASDAAAIMTGSAWRVWRSKVRGVHEAGSAVTERGRYIELAVALWAADLLGAPLLRARPVRHPVLRWATATPDYRLGHRAGPLLEVKTTTDMDGYGEEGTDEVPAYVEAQCRWQMLCSSTTSTTTSTTWSVARRPVVVVAVLRWGGWTPPAIYFVRRDPHLEAELVSTVGTWWRTCVVARKRPTVDASVDCTRDLAATPRGTTWRPATPAQRDLVAAWETQRWWRASCAQLERLYRNQILEAIGPCRGLDLGGYRLTRGQDGRLTRSKA